MNLIEVMERFPDQESCIAHLEKIRWNGNPECPHCESKKLTHRKHESETGRIGRWNCQECKATFKVTCGTVFHGAKIPLQKWFLAISLMANAKKGLSSCQLARDLDLNQKSAWFLMQRIRAEMATKGNVLLQGIIEADETYIGGKPRKENKVEDREPAKRGRGTSKTAVIGAVERDGQVVAEVASKLTGRYILDFITRFVEVEGTTLMTDEYIGYKALANMLKHEVINHQEQYVDGDKRTNTIEGFWSLLKRAWYGQHHHYSVGYTPLYVAERCYLYNNRKTENVLWKFLRESMQIKQHQKGLTAA